jgi:hypothetical protein
MAYIIQRKDRFYVVAYDGIDPLTGRERRRWHPAGHDRHEAEQMVERIERDNAGSAPARGGPIKLSELLTDTWLPIKRRHVRTSTAYRYSWMVDHYINPAIGQVPLRRLRADHLDGLYDQLATTGGRNGDGLAPKTVHEVHMIVRSSLDLAWRRRLVDTNVAQATNARHKRQTRQVPRSWTATELGLFLATARPHRLYPALHLTAYTGMRHEVRSAGSNGPTSTARTVASRSFAPCRASPVSPSSFRSIPVPAAAASTSTMTPWRCSPVGDGNSRTTGCPMVPTTGCS